MKRRAFTLIELLVVISIIALLLSILLPALKRVRMAARAAVCLTDTRGLSLAWLLYKDDNDGRLVGAHDGHAGSASRDYDWVNVPRDSQGNVVAGNVATVKEKQRGIEAGALFPYVDHLGQYHCPGDRRHLTTASTTAGYGHAWRSYSIPSCMNGGIHGGRSITKYQQIKTPANKYIFIEEDADVDGFNWGGWSLAGPINGNWDQWWDPIAIRHGEKNMMSYADGHAERRLWVDERTLEMAEGQIFGLITPDNPDLKYMNRNYAQQ